MRKKYCKPVYILCAALLFSTFLVMAVTGLSAEFILRKTESKEDWEKEESEEKK